MINYGIILIIVLILAYFYKVTLQRTGSGIVSIISNNLPTLDFLYY